MLVLVRPETVDLAPVGDGQASDPTSLTGVVVSHIFLGSTTRVRIEDESGERGMTADLPTSRAATLTIGMPVTASFPPESARLLSLAEQPAASEAPVPAGR